MKVLGHKTLPIDKLILPDHWKAVLASEHSQDIGQSMEEVGQIQDPVVRKRDNKVLVGLHRIAGRKRHGHTDVYVKLVECTDAEGEAMSLAENLKRRHDPEWQWRLREHYVAALEREEAQKIAKGEVERKRGPRPSARSLAMKRAAAEFGVSQDALRKQTERKKKPSPKPYPDPVSAKEVGQAGTPAEAPRYANFDPLGMEVDKPFLAQAAQVQDYVNAAAKKVMMGLRELGKLENSELPFPSSRLDRLRQVTRETHHMLKGAVPVSLCPFCKGLDGAQEQCAGCQRVGYITQDQFANVPEELLDEYEPKVIVQGVTYTVEEWAAHHLTGEELETDVPEGEDPWPM